MKRENGTQLLPLIDFVLYTAAIVPSALGGGTAQHLCAFNAPIDGLIVTEYRIIEHTFLKRMRLTRALTINHLIRCARSQEVRLCGTWHSYRYGCTKNHLMVLWCTLKPG